LTPADLQGVKVRVMNDPVAMDMIEALGGSPAPISMGELYTALKQGVVDAAENNPPTFVASRHYEVCPHFTFDHHSRIPDVLVMSADVWESLSAEEQSWLQQAAQEASVYQRTAWEEKTAKAIEVMRENGVTIHEVDQSAFSQAARSVTERYAEGDLRTLVERIREVAP
jgi:TRAP-type C4-dicarboxylate transport system substrate-binding protein